MKKVFNAMMEVSVEFVFDVKAMNMEEANQVANENVNDYDTQFDNELTLMSPDGEITFKQCENQIEVEEVFFEGGEYKACGTANLVLSKNIKAYTLEQAQFISESTFNDFYLSMGMIEVKNAQNESVKLSVGDYNIGEVNVEKAEGDSIAIKLEEILENFQNTLVLQTEKGYN